MSEPVQALVGIVLGLVIGVAGGLAVLALIHLVIWGWL